MHLKLVKPMSLDKVNQIHLRSRSPSQLSETSTKAYCSLWIVIAISDEENLICGIVFRLQTLAGFKIMLMTLFKDMFPLGNVS